MSRPRAPRAARPRPTLWYLPYSPWSRKARWAIAHARYEVDEREYLPMVQAPVLRLKTRSPERKITVPLLIDGDLVLRDSFEIAAHVDRGHPAAPPAGDGDAAPTSLFAVPRDQIATWNERSERVLQAARARVVRRFEADPEALRESVPAFVPERARTALVSIASTATRFLRRKYALDRVRDDDVLALLRRTLAQLRAALGGDALTRDGRPRYLVDERFSYADVAMAVTLQPVVPDPAPWLELGPASRRCWTTPELAQEFADLVAWRDALLRDHYPLPS